ncbi:transcription termination/antitermination protein NusG [Cereibacter changlensis]|nr:transcription termination/antitermination NusG family protein [Cereibacter changlensis]
MPMRLVKNEDFVTMRWHLVLCKPNQHHIARRCLSRLACEVFLPQLHAERRWRGRILKELRPVFPGYLFVGIDPARPLWQPVRTAQGVSRIIGFGEQGPAVVPAEIVAGLMARCDVDGVLHPVREELSVGDKIKIISGPFANFVTSIDKIDADRRLHVLLDLLGHPTKVLLDPSMVVLRS